MNIVLTLKLCVSRLFKHYLSVGLLIKVWCLVLIYLIIVYCKLTYPRYLPQIFVAVVHNNYLYMLGGCINNLDINLKYIHQYNPENSTWKLLIPKGDVPSGRKSQFSLAVNNKVYVSCSISKYPSSLSASTMQLLFLGLTNDYFPKDVIKKCKVNNELHVLNLST